MGGGGVGLPPPPSLRAVAAAALAMWLVPVVLTVAVLWLPLLCCAVAAVRFKRVRRTRRGQLRGCRDADGGGRWTEGVDAGYRMQLLDQYLEDQMVLVGAADAGEGGRETPDPADAGGDGS